MLITFEGIDFSGKSTQVKLLVAALERSRCEVVLLREPGGTPISEKIRAMLLDVDHRELTHEAELFLFSAARAQLVSQVIRPALASRKIVVCDRFYDSTTAYQGYGRGIDPGGVRAVNGLAAAGVVPGLTILVDVTVEEVVRRRAAAGLSADRIEAAGREFFERVRSGYRAMADAERARWVVVDGMRAPAQIHEEIWSAVQSRISHSGA